MFFFQSRDLAAAERGEAKAAVAQDEIKNPATMEEPALWASMAVKPIDKDALRARKDVWGAARGSMRLGMLICLLIFLAVPPIYLLDTFVPLLIGAPLIALIAMWKGLPMIGGGGDVAKAYDTANRAMAPLGLALTERLEITIEPKSVAPFRLGPGRPRGDGVRRRAPWAQGDRAHARRREHPLDVPGPRRDPRARVRVPLARRPPQGRGRRAAPPPPRR